MTAKEIQRRNVKAESLKVLQSEDGKFFVESEKGKVLYHVVLGNDANTCTCGDYSTGIRKDKNHQCKHVLAVINAIPRKEVEGAQFCERPVPRLDDRFMINGFVHYIPAFSVNYPDLECPAGQSPLICLYKFSITVLSFKRTS